MALDVAQSLVLESLHQAASQNAEELKPAETKLKEWEIEPGFHTVLLNIFCSHEVDVNVRWLAVLYFKNGVDRYWRKNACNAISDEEKVVLRQGLVKSLEEPVNQIATQLAVLISKVARYDCPREWPELIPTLVEGVKSQEELVQHRSLLTLHHVMKTLSTKRLGGDKLMFQVITANIFDFILNFWNAHTELFLQEVCRNYTNVARTLEKALLSLRILRKLTVYGIKKPHEVERVVMFVRAVFERCRAMLECRKSLINTDLQETCEKYIILLTKVLLELLEHHPFSYIQFITQTLEFSTFYIFTDEGKSFLFERFVIQCLNLIKGMLMCVEYRPAKIAEDVKDPRTMEADRIKQAFFSNDILTRMCRDLVLQYLLLRRSDLEQWDADAEGFASDEGGESWKYSLRPCTESVFMALFHEFSSALVPVLLDLVQKNISPVSSFDVVTILKKDAIYNAIGLAAFDLYDEIDFDDWFKSTLLVELQNKDPNYRVLRRRIIWLVGQWSGVKFSPENRPELYEAVLPLLHQQEDFVVRIAAANALRVAVDDFDFNVEQFLPFLEPTFGLLFSLLQEANECETKMQVLYVMSFIIERIGVSVRPHANGLVQYLPLLWEESSEHNMLRCSILTTLVSLVQALGTISENLYSFLIPVLKMSTDASLPSHVYLLEDGLELWLTTLHNASSLHPSLLQLYEIMPPLLEYSSENLRTCLQITQAYILLASENFLKIYGAALMQSCRSMITDMKAEGIVMVMRLCDNILRTLPQQGPEIIQVLLPIVFQGVYDGEEYPMVMSMYLTVLGRVFMNNRAVFVQVVSDISAKQGRSIDQVFGKIVDVWLEKMPLVSSVEKRKLLGLALSGMLTSQSSVILDHFCGILLGIVEVLNDLVRITDTGNQVDSMILTDVESVDLEDGDYETEHDHRKRQLALTDPVHSVVLRDYLQSQLQELRSQLGPTHFDQLLQTVDVETMDQLKEHISSL